MALRERQLTEDDRLALAIGRYVLGEYTLEEAAAFARVGPLALIQPFDSEHVARAIEASEQSHENPRTGVNMMDVPAGTALGETSPLERYRSIKEGVQERVNEEDIDEDIVEDAVEWARTE